MQFAKKLNRKFPPKFLVFDVFSVYQWIDLELETLYSKISEEYFRKNKIPIF